MFLSDYQPGLGNGGGSADVVPAATRVVITAPKQAGIPWGTLAIIAAAIAAWHLLGNKRRR